MELIKCIMHRAFVWYLCVSLGTHIGVDLGVTDSKGSPLVQQHATVSRALIQILFLIRTPWDCGVGLLVTAVETHKEKWWLLVDECICINVCVRSR